MYAGIDPLTGRNHYLKETASTEDKARRALRLLAEGDEQSNARTKATLGVAMDE